MHSLHKHKINPKTVQYLIWAFSINLLLTLIEIIAGVIGGSIALVGDALHNLSDAFSILIAIMAYKIGMRQATLRFSYGFKRAEIIGSFVNLILLFISGSYLLYEGILKIIMPQKIDGALIIVVSIFALGVDIVTARLSHKEAAHNTNMKILFFHNLADVLGSVGVIVSGIFVLLFDWNFVDGLIAVLIACYMILQVVVSFPLIITILMDASPMDIDIEEIKNALLSIKGIKDVHHIHVWYINEHEIGFDCHIVGDNLELISEVNRVLKENFDILHTTIQLERDKNCLKCHL